MGKQLQKRKEENDRIRHNRDYVLRLANIVGVLMENGLIPKRSNVDWEINEHGLVVITVDKILGKFETKISDIFNAPKKVRRKLDDMNSKLWLLMDGKNTIEEIINAMDEEFAEKISPVAERVSKSIAHFLDLGYAEITNIRTNPNN